MAKVELEIESNVEKLQREFVDFSKTTKKTNQNIEKSFSKLEKALGATSSELKGLNKSFKESSKETGKTSKNLKDVSSSAKKASSSYKSMKGSMEGSSKAAAKTKKSTDAVAKSAKTTSKASKQTKKNIEETDKKAKVLKGTFIGIGGALGGVVITQINKVFSGLKKAVKSVFTFSKKDRATFKEEFAKEYSGFDPKSPKGQFGLDTTGPIEKSKKATKAFGKAFTTVYKEKVTPVYEGFNQKVKQTAGFFRSNKEAALDFLKLDKAFNSEIMRIQPGDTKRIKEAKKEYKKFLDFQSKESKKRGHNLNKDVNDELAAQLFVEKTKLQKMIQTEFKIRSTRIGYFTEADLVHMKKTREQIKRVRDLGNAEYERLQSNAVFRKQDIENIDKQRVEYERLIQSLEKEVALRRKISKEAGTLGLTTKGKFADENLDAINQIAAQNEKIVEAKKKAFKLDDLSQKQTKKLAADENIDAVQQIATQRQKSIKAQEAGLNSLRRHIPTIQESNANLLKTLENQTKAIESQGSAYSNIRKTFPTVKDVETAEKIKNITKSHADNLEKLSKMKITHFGTIAPGAAAAGAAISPKTPPRVIHAMQSAAQSETASQTAEMEKLAKDVEQAFEKTASMAAEAAQKTAEAAAGATAEAAATMSKETAEAIRMMSDEFALASTAVAIKSKKWQIFNRIFGKGPGEGPDVEVVDRKGFSKLFNKISQNFGKVFNSAMLMTSSFYLLNKSIDDVRKGAEFIGRRKQIKELEGKPGSEKEVQALKELNKQAIKAEITFGNILIRALDIVAAFTLLTKVFGLLWQTTKLKFFFKIYDAMDSVVQYWKDIILTVVTRVKYFFIETFERMRFKYKWVDDFAKKFERKAINKVIKKARELVEKSRALTAKDIKEKFIAMAQVLLANIQLVGVKTINVILSTMKKVFASISNFSLKIVAALKTVGNTISSFIIEAVSPIVTFMEGVFAYIKSTSIRIMSTISAFMSKVFGVISKLYLKTIGVFKAFGKVVGKAMTDAFMKVSASMVELYKIVSSVMTDVFMKVSAIMADFYKRISATMVKFYKRISATMLGFYKRISASMIGFYKRVSGAMSVFYKKISSSMVAFYKRISVAMLEFYKKVASAMVGFYQRTSKRFRNLFEKMLTTLSVFKTQMVVAFVKLGNAIRKRFTDVLTKAILQASSVLRYRMFDMGLSILDFIATSERLKTTITIFKVVTYYLQDFGKAIKALVLKIGVLNTVIIALALIITVKVIKAFSDLIKEVVKAGGKLESTRLAFEQFFASAKKSDILIKKLKKTMRDTPFTFEQLAELTKRLLPSLNYNMKLSIETIKMLGDVAGGQFSKMETMVKVYQRALDNNVLQTQEFNMMVDAGIPILQGLAQEMGVAKDQVRRLAREQKITSTIFINSLKRMTEEGGIFNEAAKKQSRTLEGLQSTLKSIRDELKEDIGELLLPISKAWIRLKIRDVEFRRKLLFFPKTLMDRFRGTRFIEDELDTIEDVEEAIVNLKKEAGDYSWIRKFFDGVNRAQGFLEGTLRNLRRNLKYVKDEALGLSIIEQRRTIDPTIKLYREETRALLATIDDKKRLGMLDDEEVIREYARTFRSAADEIYKAVPTSAQPLKHELEKLIRVYIREAKRLEDSLKKPEDREAAIAEGDTEYIPYSRELTAQEKLFKNALNAYTKYRNDIKAQEEEGWKDTKALLAHEKGGKGFSLWSSTFNFDKEKEPVLTFAQFVSQEQQKLRDEELQKEREAAAEKAQIVQDTANQIIGIAETMHGAIRAMEEHRIEGLRIDAEKERGIDNEKKAAELKALRIQHGKEEKQKDAYEIGKDAIEAKYAKKEADRKKKLAHEEAKIKRSSAIADKAMSAFKVVLSTPVAIANIWATHGANPILAGSLTALAVANGVAQLAAIAAAPLPRIPDAETGGRFIVPPMVGNPSAAGGVGPDNVGLRVNPGETVDVLPRGEEGGRNIRITVNLDRQAIIDFVQDGFDSGEITINEDQLVRV